MVQIKVITSHFYPMNTANAHVITQRVMALSKKFNIYVNTLGDQFSQNLICENVKTTRSNNLLFLIVNQFQTDNCDIVLTYHHNYSTAYAALIWKLLKKRKWIAMLSDPSHDISPFKQTYSDSNLAKKILRSIYNFFYNYFFEHIPMLLIKKFADLIVFNDIYQQKYVTNFYPIKNYEILQMGYSLRQRTMKNTSLSGCNFIYFGDLYGPRNAFELFNVLNNFYDFFIENNCTFTFYGNYQLTTEQYFMKYSNISKFVKLKPRISKELVNNIINDASVLLVVDANLNSTTEIYPYTPSKIIDYLATDKPIFGVSMENSPTRDICVDSKNWWTNFDEESIFITLQKCINEYKDYIRDSAYCDNFDIAIKNKELVDIIKCYL